MSKSKSKSKSKKRFNKLIKLLKKIEDLNNLDLDKLYPLDKTEREQVLMKDFNNGPTIPRGEYESPLERSQYNYGYMTIGEIGAGTPNVW